MSKNIIAKVFEAVKALITRRVVIRCDNIPYEFNNVPLRKIVNWILVELSVYFKPQRPWGWPTHFQIEPANTCNLSCVLCPVYEGMDRKSGMLDIAVFRKLIDEAGDYIFLILLWDWGEPFMNPDVYSMISYAKKKGIKVVSSTNGHFFVKEENADRLIRSGIDSIIFAMDGITQETYSRYRSGGELESVIKALSTVVSRKRDLNSKTPFINLRFIPMKHNEHEMPELKDMARSIGVDALTIKTLNPCTNDTYALKRPGKDRSPQDLMPDNYNHRRFKYKDDGQTLIRRKKNPCKQLWNSPVIHWDGTVCFCTYDYNDKYALGSIKGETFWNVWSGRSYRDVRRQFRYDWEQMAMCSACSYAYEGGSCIDETIADAFFFGPEKGV
ncbi:MAG: radical SAM protein [Thermodesulfovibrionia bacterium]|nr:radical SAM protein [Thermodesulfovibrionia bacterium]